MDKSHLLRFGRDLLKTDFTGGREASFITMDEPWREAVDFLRLQPRSVHRVSDMEAEAVLALERAVPGVELIVGLGGGSSLDAAKYVAWRRGLPLVLIPSAVSVDACVTSSIAIREGGRVRYVGHVVPEQVLVDFGLIRRAPMRLNRAGAGDVLSIHTALFDWRLAHERNGERYDPLVAQAAAALVEGLGAAAEKIREVSDAGIISLIKAFAREDSLLEELGSARPEEGSEHFFAYNVEYRTGRRFIHGELVALGIALMCELQGNRPQYVRALLDRIGISFSPSALGLTIDEIVDCLRTLPEYVQAEGLPYSQANLVDASDAPLRAMVERVLRA